MVTPSQRASSRKQAKKLMALGRERRRLNLMKQGKRLLSDSVIRALAAAGLPAEKSAYEAKLQELDA